MVTTASAIDSKETVNLIGSDKVDGTAVYGADGNKIGSIQRVMIDKLSGKVAYAVLSFGGFLGMGEDYYPVPLVNAQIRHKSWRLPRQSHCQSARKGTEIYQEHRLELEPRERSAGLQLL